LAGGKRKAIMENMKVVVESEKPCAVTLSVELPSSAVSSETEKVYAEIQRSAQIPGFRAGKAPMDMVKKNFVSTAKQKVAENLIHNSVFKALADKKVEPVYFPKVENIDFDFEKPFKFKFTAERHPVVKAVDYKGIKIAKKENHVDDARVKESLEALLERNSRLEESKTDIVNDKHFLMVDYDASIDGQPVAELKAKNHLIDMSSPQTIAGFKEGLTGVKKGEAREVKVKFPAEHPNKKIAGKEAVFTITVKEMKEKVLPALDDEFARDLGLKDLAELTQRVKESLEIEEKRRQDQEVNNQIIESLVKSNQFEVPATMVEEQSAFLFSKASDYLKQQGVPEASLKGNLDKLKDKYKEQADKDVRLSYILNSISEIEKISVSDEDLKKELEAMYSQNKGREKDVEKYFNENKDKLSAHIKEEKIFKFILDNAKIK